jgi:hypothetical protein
MEKELISDFQNVTKDLISILSPLTEQQLNKIPFSHSWTSGQVGDHLLKSYSSWTIFCGETAITNRPIDHFCKPLSEIFLNYDIKLTAEPSDFNYPSKDFISRNTLLNNIQTIIDNIINFSNHNELGVLCLDLEFPTIGHLTRFEWLHFHKVHTQRHIRQLKNIINHIKSN